MLADFLDKYKLLVSKYQFIGVCGLVLWVIGGFIASQLIVVLALNLIAMLVPVHMTNEVVFSVTVALFVYIIGLVLIVGVPAWLKKWTWKDLRHRLGLKERPNSSFVIAGIIGFLPYIAIAMLLTWIATHFFSGFDPGQAQDLGFKIFHNWGEASIGFLIFVILAPFAEELFFRGFLFKGLRKYLPFFFSALLTSLLFGLAHGQFNVGIDTFALSLVLCFLYEATGSLWPAIFLHMLKNGIAFSSLLALSSLQ